MGFVHVMGNIAAERVAQDKKWGPDRNLDNRTWLTILMEEVGEVAKADLERDVEGFRQELVQVAAVAVAAIENIDRRSMT